MCARDRIPLTGVLESAAPYLGDAEPDRAPSSGRVLLATLRLDALFPSSLWRSPSRPPSPPPPTLWAAENARRSREALAAWVWTFARVRGEGHDPGVGELGDARPPDGPEGPGPSSSTPRRDAAGTLDPLGVASAFASVPSPTAARRARAREAIAAETAAAGPFFGGVPDEALRAIFASLAKTSILETRNSKDDAGDPKDTKDDGGGGPGPLRSPPKKKRPPSSGTASPSPFGAGVGADLARVAATCRLLRDAARETAPGLRCRLFPHQRDALRAMCARETGRGLAPHPALRRLACVGPDDDETFSGERVGGGDDARDAFFSETGAGGASEERVVGSGGRERGVGVQGSSGKPRFVAWVLASEIRDGAYFPGAFHAGPSLSPRAGSCAAFADARGGVFADDPGLGKSVTALALVAKTRGLLPTPPPGTPRSEVTRGTPPSYALPAPTRARALERWWARVPTAATDEAEAAETERDAARRGEETSGRDARGPGDAESTISRAETIDLTEPSGSSLAEAAAEKAEKASAEKASEEAFRERASEKEAPPPTSEWVACDDCGRWRRLPSGVAAPAEGEAWYCQMQDHVPPALRACSAPEERPSEEEWTKEAAGCYAPERERPGRERNVRHFLRLVRETRREERESGGAASRGLDDTARLCRLMVAWLRRRGRAEGLEPGGEGLVPPADMASAGARLLAKALHPLPPPPPPPEEEEEEEGRRRGRGRGRRHPAGRAVPRGGVRRRPEEQHAADASFGVQAKAAFGRREDAAVSRETKGEEEIRDASASGVRPPRDVSVLPAL